MFSQSTNLLLYKKVPSDSRLGNLRAVVLKVFCAISIIYAFPHDACALRSEPVKDVFLEVITQLRIKSEHVGQDLQVILVSNMVDGLVLCIGNDSLFVIPTYEVRID